MRTPAESTVSNEFGVSRRHELAVRWSKADEGVRKEVIVRIRYQATAVKDIAN
jgi:hypothetical protein